ncbi:ABC transporter ATP-binding protein/permease [Bosea sp. MMO-172]|uniref:ABC transporter ATP-binding protein/permease n=1 Tax=Bosea sp. MMO-172 TaxID=3127885 RepID=UPI003019F105
MAGGFQKTMMKALGATDHVMTVLSVTDIAPGFRRIRLAAPTMIDGRETPTASYVRLWAPDPIEPGKVHQRGYTLVDPDAATGEVSFDFVLHEPMGPASGWAAAAQRGDTITASYYMFHKFDPPEDPEGYLLMGDPAAIPAINAILGELPPEAQVVVILQANLPGDAEIPVTSHPGAEILWTGAGTGALAAAVPARDWSNWYAWVAAENTAIKQLRVALNQTHGFPLADIKHTAYWIRGKAMRLRKEAAPAPEEQPEPAVTQPAVEAASAVVGKAAPERPARPRRWRSQGGTELLATLRWKLRAAGVLQGLISLMQLAPLVLLAELGRRLLAGQTRWENLSGLALWAIGLYGAAAVLSAALMLSLHAVDARFGHALRLRVVAKLARLPLGWFTDRNAASVHQAVQEDAGRLHYMITHAVPDVVAGIVTPVAVIVYLFTVDAGLAAMLFLPLIAFVALFSHMMRGVADKLVIHADWTKRANAAASAFVEALPVVRVFGGDGRALRETLDGQAGFLNGWQRPMAGRKVASQLAIQPPAFLLLIVATGCWRIISGGMAPADLLPFLFLGAAFGAQIMAVMYGFVPLREAKQAARRIGLLLEEAELDRSRSLRSLPPGPLGLRFEAASFGYRPRKPVLHGIDLDLKPGTLTALVGPSGAGKSTLAGLPGRFHDVTGGAVRIVAGGEAIDIRDLTPEALQSAVGFVFQDVRLIKGTLRDNIALARPGAAMAEIEAAARAAQIHERILALPRGYDSVVGEDARLSGGEAQRLSIARALLADPPILVLDEATAFVDPESEHLVQQALSALIGQRTVLVVAHRLHTITHADCIAVMQAGRIVQRGRHDELLFKPGLYRDLWQAGAERKAS